MPPAASRLEVIPLAGIPLVTPGDDLAEFLVTAIRNASIELRENDVLVVAQKVVSKAEGAVVELASIEPGDEAIQLAEVVKKDPRLVEVILSCTRRIVRAVPGVLITETHHGLVCANAGVDASNSIAPDTLILLPRDPDGSALSLRQQISRAMGVSPAVVISDTFNRP